MRARKKAAADGIQKRTGSRNPAREKLGAMDRLPGVPGGRGPYAGASGRHNLIDWYASSGDADSDLLPALRDLRDKSQDLYRNDAVARAAVKRLADGTLGTGLVMRSTIDREYLGLSEDQALAWEDAAEREFTLWSESRECDFARRLNFSEMQRLAFTSQLLRGDSFILMSWLPRPGVPYDLRLQLIESDRVSNPQYLLDDEKIAGGIERDKDGVPVAIHIQKTHPGSIIVAPVLEWKRVGIHGNRTGRRQVLHLMEFERIDQSRGEPVLAPVIEPLKQLSKYSEAELQAAVVNAVLTLFIKRPLEGDHMTTGASVQYTDEQRERWLNTSLKLGSGTLIEGAPGEDVQMIASTRPNAQYDPFFASTLKRIGMALGEPYEVLAQIFQSSYSASRAAILEFGKTARIKRGWMVSNFCQPCYEEWLYEAVITGQLDAPGFLTDPRIRAAYSCAVWMGPSAGQIDPVKEVQAAQLRIGANLSTYGREVAELTGADFEQTARIKSKEVALLKKLGLHQEPQPAWGGGGFASKQGEKQEEEKQEKGDAEDA